jgi:hypothetical protein
LIAATIEKDIFLDNATFVEEANFLDLLATGVFYARSATFKKGAILNSVIFKKRILFNKSIFEGETYFTKALIEGNAEFTGEVVR